MYLPLLLIFSIYFLWVYDGRKIEKVLTLDVCFRFLLQMLNTVEHTALKALISASPSIARTHMKVYKHTYTLRPSPRFWLPCSSSRLLTTLSIAASVALLLPPHPWRLCLRLKGKLELQQRGAREMVIVGSIVEICDACEELVYCL